VHAESKLGKVLLVTNDLGPHAGGIESFILGLIGELDGSRIVIYTSSEDGDREFDKKLVEEFGVAVIRDRSKTLLPTPRVNRAVAKVMKQYGCEYIWFGAAAPLGWMSGYLRREGARRIVALTHGHEVWWSKVWPFSLIMRAMGRQIDAFGYLGDFTRGAMQRAIGDRAQMVRIAPGIAIDHFLPGVKSESLIEKYTLHNKNVIVCVGRLVPRKGQDRLIEAMPEIVKRVPNAVLLLVGEGSYRKHLNSLIQKHDLAEYVKCVGRVQYSELPAYIRLGDIFAMPSRSRLFGLEVEGLGIVYLEASSCGIPVIAGSSGGAPDAVIEGKTGFVVDGKNIDSIAQACISLLLNPELRQSMGVSGRRWAEESWSWSMWGKRFSALLFGE
jgi:phosphatidylinositol alpha-1,6-mannosyltransferase